MQHLPKTEILKVLFAANFESGTLTWKINGARGKPREGNLAEAKVDAERYRLELRFIANADPKQWDAEVRDQFQQWAQSRAREAIDAAMKEDK